MAATRLASVVLQDLASVAGLSEQALVLRKIKTEITGHTARKVEYIQDGLVSHLASILAGVVAEHGYDAAATTRPDPQIESTLTHISQLLGVIANGPL
jgi:hypothetical protein